MENLKKADVVIGKRGPILKIGSIKKLAVPSKDSQINGDFIGHQVVVDCLVHDTNPSNPRKGVAFFKVRHVPEKCTTCRIRLETEIAAKKRKEREAILDKNIPGWQRFRKDWLPDDLRILITNAAVSDKNMEKVLAHKDWWTKAIQLCKEAEKLDTKISLTRQKVKEDLVEAAKDSYYEASTKLEKFVQECTNSHDHKDVKVSDTGYKERLVVGVKCNLEQGTCHPYAEIQRHRMGTISVPESDDGYRSGGYIDREDWYRERELDISELDSETKNWLERKKRDFLSCYEKYKKLVAEKEAAWAEYQNSMEKAEKLVCMETEAMQSRINDIVKELKEESPYE